MSTDWNWPGARWWRVDLHAHSPASEDFRPDQDRLARDWDAWIASAANAGLHAVAVTDHNTPNGIPDIQAAAQGVDAPVVFPGVELAVGGIHLLCALDPGRSRDDVVALLAQLGIRPSEFGLPETTSTKSISEAIEIISRSGAVVIAAHANGPKGVVAELQGQLRLKALGAEGLAGVELAPVPADAKGWRDPAGSDVQRWLDGSRAEQSVSQVQCSDSHMFAETGRRFTWVKMTRPDIEGLRLALLDGSGSLRPAVKGDVGDPNRHADQVIESVTVHKAKYMGRPDALVVEFNPWLNTVIGGRGTGKSTLVDLCRLVLGRKGELDGGGETSLRAAFDKRMRIPPDRGEEGLLTDETAVEIRYRKGGERFVLAWDYRGQTTPISRLDGDQRIEEGGKIQERFPVRIYSQKQLFDLAKAPNALFTVIDDTNEVSGSELFRARKEAESKYLSLCAEARALRTQATELPTRLALLGDLRRKIELLQQGENAQTLSEYRLRRRQDETWVSAQKSVTLAIASVESAASALADVDLDDGEDAESDPAFAPLRRAYGQSRAAVQELERTVSDAVAEARRKLQAVTDGVDLTKWRVVVDASEEQYRKVSDELAQAGIPNPDEYRDLLQRAATLELETKALDKQRVAAEERERESARELGRYRALRAELTKRRRRFATQTSSALTRVQVRGFAESGDLEPFLRDVLAIPRFDGDHREIVGRIAPSDPSAGSWSYASLDTLVAELRALLADPKSRWSAQDHRFEVALRRLQPERLDRLALYAPEDAVDVSFRAMRNGANQWRSLAQGSPGEQTAALLAFVLGYGSEPIILDQPEDDLDNTVIYELLVRKLRDSKQARQIIVVTHNPNIVVHGDAELVVSLDATAGRTRVRFTGGLQEQEAREEICRVMEGGRDAFDMRYRRIRKSASGLTGSPSR